MSKSKKTTNFKYHSTIGEYVFTVKNTTITTSNWERLEKPILISKLFILNKQTNETTVFKIKDGNRLSILFQFSNIVLFAFDDNPTTKQRFARTKLKKIFGENFIDKYEIIEDEIITSLEKTLSYEQIEHTFNSSPCNISRIGSYFN